MRRGLMYAALAAGAMSALASCSSSNVSVDNSGALRPAEKSLCPEAVLDSDMPALDRVLVPYSPTLLGVETLFGSDDQRIRVISGGYLDDVFEAYDDLHEVGETEVRGWTAILLESSLLGDEVRVAVWRETTATQPCDAHAFIATGLSNAEFEQQLSLVE